MNQEVIQKAIEEACPNGIVGGVYDLTKTKAYQEHLDMMLAVYEDELNEMGYDIVADREVCDYIIYHNYPMNIP